MKDLKLKTTSIQYLMIQHVVLIIPHAVWYDEDKVTFKTGALMASLEGLPKYNKYTGRLNVLLQNHGFMWSKLQCYISLSPMIGMGRTIMTGEVLEFPSWSMWSYSARFGNRPTLSLRFVMFIGIIRTGENCGF